MLDTARAAFEKLQQSADQEIVVSFMPDSHSPGLSCCLNGFKLGNDT